MVPEVFVSQGGRTKPKHRSRVGEIIQEGNSTGVLQSLF